jgi:predicted dehydrogenase
MVVYDDMEPSEKIKIYDRGVEIKNQDTVHHVLVEYRTGNMFAPHVDQKEALSLVVKDFLDSIKTGKNPVSDGQAGLNVVRILEAADESLKHGGQVVSFNGKHNGNNKDQLSFFSRGPVEGARALYRKVNAASN